MIMETANCVLALAGDTGNTVPKFNVTAAEVAVLRLMHGEDAVTEIQPTGTVERTHRAERARLVERYGTNIEGRMQAKAVDVLFPGAAARVFETFAEQDIPEEFFAATGRSGGKAIAQREPDSVEAEQEKAPVKKAEEKEAVEPKKGKPAKVKKPTKKQLAAQAKAEAAAKAAAEAEEGVGEDMDDSVLD